MSVNIERECERTYAFDADETIKTVVDAALDYVGCPFECSVNVLLTDDASIREMNRDFRNTDRATDVLSFPLGDNGVYDVNPATGAYMLGDVVLSAEHADMQAKLYGHVIEREIAYLTVHSVLHLLGFDHVNSESEKTIMRTKEEKIMKILNLERN